MTPDFESQSNFNHSSKDLPGDGMPNQPTNHVLDTMKRDRFELLSAYLDGELSAAERKQVEEWLATDTLVQCLYARLLKLRQGIQSLPVPTSTQTSEELTAQVLRRCQRRFRQVAAWGGAAAAALVLGMISGISPFGESPVTQVASSQRSHTEASNTKVGPNRAAPDALMIALDRPVVQIPKAAISAPESAASLHPDLNRDIR